MEIDIVSVRGVSCTPKYAPIEASAAESNVIVAAVAGHKIRVLHFSFVVVAAVTATWEDSDGTNLTGGLPCFVNGGMADQAGGLGLFETGAGKGLNLLLSDAVAVGGALTYILIPV